MGLTFLARQTNAIPNFCGDGSLEAIPYNVVDYSINGCFVTNLFTAPATGDYIFASALSLGNLSIHELEAVWTMKDVSSLVELWVSEFSPANIFIGSDDSVTLSGGGVFLPISLRKGQQLTQIIGVSSSPSAKTVSLNGSLAYNQVYWAGFQVA
jgi:hypothetical protein